YFLELVSIYRVSESAHFYPSQMRHWLTVSRRLPVKIQKTLQGERNWLQFAKQILRSCLNLSE
ncbi:MAG: hypothetical protein MJY77_02060, partial [Bacteroidaceae bacterium]|nr:hypothetical protein [Bacteroidaceae bacterium]